MGEVRLVDLEIIKRYSLAVRQESAPAEELLAVIDASRDAVTAAIAAHGGPTPATAARRSARKATASGTRKKKAAG